MLIITGISIILVILILILWKKTSALTALLIVPIVGALIAGFGEDTAKFAIEGIKNIAPVATMFIFAILFFGVLTDAGMFDPVVSGVIKFVGNDPAKVAVGAAFLSMIVHLDGSGAVTFLITVPAMLPLFERLKMDRRILAGVVALGAGTMNLVPWGGPTLRAATALNINVTDLYNPLIIPQICGLITVLVIAWYLGKREGKKIKQNGEKIGEKEISLVKELDEKEKNLRRPKMFLFNIVLTIITIGILISGKIPPAIVFMLASTLALLINYPKIAQQKTRIDAHAPTALMMAGILLAAGVFTGIMKGSGMIDAMAQSVAGNIPEGLGGHLPVLLAVISMPLSMFFDPDSYYFGILPVLSGIGEHIGIPAIQLGQASLMGQMTTGFPLSPLTPATFLLIGLAKIDLAEHQKFTFKFAFLITLVMTAVAVLCGVFPL